MQASSKKPTVRPKAKRVTARPSKRDDPAQSRAFIKKARELGADEENSEADEVLGVLHKKRPEPQKKQKRRSTN